MKKLPTFLTNLDPKCLFVNNFIVLDFETTNKEKGSALEHVGNDIVLACWYDSRDGKIHSHFGGMYDQKKLYEAVMQADLVVAHNAKYELQWLARMGVEIAKVLPWCTMVAQHVYAGNRKFHMDLDSVGNYWGFKGKKSLVSLLIESGVCPSQIPENWLLEYCVQDVRLALNIFLKQRKELKELELIPVLYTRLLTTIVLADIETKGMTLDPKRVEDEYKRTLSEYNDLWGRIQEFTGGVNPRSPKQMGVYLYDTLKFEELTDHKGEVVRTKTDGRCTGIDVVLQLKAKTQEQKEFKKLVEEFSPLKVAKSTLEKMRQCCIDAEKEGKPPILYASFNQTVTQTHRLSSSGQRYKIQFQNIDRDFKQLFTTRQPKWLVGPADGRQLEFRVAGHMGDDPQIREDARSNADVHRFTASVIFNKPGDKVAKHERTAAKTHTFKPLYGGQSGTPAQKKYYTAFKEKYNGVAKTQEGWTYTVLAEKKLRIPSGLIFYWPDVSISKSGYISNTGNIYNYPIQSFATADIIPIALVYVWYMIWANEDEMFIVNTVHDSIVTEMPETEKEVFEQYVKEAFTTLTFTYLEKVYGVKFTCPLGVEYSWNEYWDEADDDVVTQYDYDPLGEIDEKQA